MERVGSLQAKKIRSFRAFVWKWYAKNKRDLPWRRTRDPYKIWVSEVMLQQTQVERVIPRYRSFLKKFPTVQALAQASTKAVLTEWIGLGYNRRALNLRRGAIEVVKNHRGVLPKGKEDLIRLHGIGEYTAGAIRAFAWNLPDALIETNIRTVFIYHFFQSTKKKIDDASIKKLVALSADPANSREWHWALMDYGSYLKKEKKISNERAQAYTKQSPLKGSNREVRGLIVKILAQKGSIKYSDATLYRLFGKERTEAAFAGLVKEKMVVKNRGVFRLNRH